MSTRQITVTINDDDPGYVTFNLSPVREIANMSEGGPSSWQLLAWSLSNWR